MNKSVRVFLLLMELISSLYAWIKVQVQIKSTKKLEKEFLILSQVYLPSEMAHEDTLLIKKHSFFIPLLSEIYL